MVRRRHRPGRLAALILALFLFGQIAGGCSEDPVIGPRDDLATVALIRYEDLGDGMTGVVYRRVNRFESLIASSQMPVLVVFYSSLAPINSLVIPRLEQMADDYRDRLQIVWIDAGAERQLAESFKVETLPQFTMVVGAVLKRSLIGFDDQGYVRLIELISPYLTS